jgi:UDP-N-acetylmuramyl tripeptide synthase
MPGRIALRIYPNLLAVLSKSVKVVAVTGTNGKTTSSRIIEEAFSEQKLSYFANRSGANLLSGITTEFVMNSTLLGKAKKEYAIIECDEAAAVRVFPQLRPKVIVITNLFRDQLDRYGEVTHTLSNIRTAVSTVPEATLCLNADCSLTASLANDLPNSVVYFGIEKDAVPSAEKPLISDATHCIRCKTEYIYHYITFGHLGGFECPKCGYHREKADYSVIKVLRQGSDGSSIQMSLRGQNIKAEVNLPALYNVYNAAGSIAAIMEMGFSADTAVNAVEKFQCGFGRMEKFNLGGGTRLMLAKNPAGCNQVLEFLKEVKNPFVLVLCLNDRSADGTDISWIWDVDYEALPSFSDNLKEIIVSGDRAADMLLRIKYTGFPLEKIFEERNYEQLVQKLSGYEDQIFIIRTYTAMLDLRKTLIRHCGGADFWE